MNKKMVYDFFHRHLLAVVATVTQNGEPEAAVVGFGVTEDLTLLLGTSNSSRKYKNLQINNKIAYVIGGDENITVQYEGEAYLLENGIELDRLKQIYHQKNPEAKEFEDLPDQRYFKIIPSWIRYSDFNFVPPKIFEIRF